jgi:hypothetical protein
MKFFVKLSNGIAELWNIFLTVGYVIIILLAGFALFTLPDQAKDFVYIMLQSKEEWYLYAPLVCGAVIIWSYMTWFSACIMLQTDPLNFDLTKRYVQVIVLYTPRVLGVIPFIIMTVTFAFTPNLPDDSALLAAILINIVIGISIFFLFVWLDKIDERKKINKNQILSKRHWPDQDELFKHYKYAEATDTYDTTTKSEKKINKNIKLRLPDIWDEVTFIKRFQGMRIYFFIIGSVVLMFTILMCFNKIALHISSFLKPATVLILILTLYTYVFTVFYYFNDLKRRPIIIIIFFEVGI